jgi:hypothetical protein
MSLTSIDGPFLSRSSGEYLHTSAYLLSLISPVFYRMVCGHFQEKNTRQLNLECVDRASFQKLLSLACGVNDISVADLDELLALAALADRFGIPEVREAAEREAARLVTVTDCADLLRVATESGLPLLESACRRAALAQFTAVAATEGFAALAEEELGQLLEDDGLVAGGEEEVLEALLRWMCTGPDGRLRGIPLLDKVGILAQYGSNQHCK